MFARLLNFKKEYQKVEKAIDRNDKEINASFVVSKKEWNKWNHLNQKRTWSPKKRPD